MKIIEIPPHARVPIERQSFSTLAFWAPTAPHARPPGYEFVWDRHFTLCEFAQSKSVWDRHFPLCEFVQSKSVWDRHVFGTDICLEKKLSTKTFLFPHRFGFKQLYFGLHDPRIPNNCLVLKLNPGKWVKKSDKHTNIHTELREF